jgi:hypothetical protein
MAKIAQHLLLLFCLFYWFKLGLVLNLLNNDGFWSDLVEIKNSQLEISACL